MIAAVIVAGVIAHATMWWLVTSGRVSFWRATSVTFLILGLSAALLRDPGSFDLTVLATGAVSGVALYAGTWIAVGVLVRSSAFAASVSELYGRSGERSMPLVWVLTVAVAVPGEELFWRALVLPELQDATSVIIGASLVWLGYLAVNAVSRNLAIIAAAVVCGGVWTILGTVDAFIAPLASHLAWTSLMLAWPPAGDRAKVST
ncbi:MAG TPA: CPBP family glutamic-type intramembrane protease [Actinomycetota bacterium]|nr:CPBP family glutamic-type intramembrane protease [Actinomycetota bacterium]